MLKPVFILTIVCFTIYSSVFAMVNKPKPTAQIKQVIYLTLDGVRWQDFYLDHNQFPKFWQHHAKQAVFYGDLLSNKRMETASLPISLPSYQSQMTGQIQSCPDNRCGRVPQETLLEVIVTKRHLPKKKVATFASWPEIGYALEHIPGATYSNTGNRPALDPDSGRPDKQMNEINQLQTKDYPYSGERYDKYTFAQAWHYWKKYKPLFLWISLNDADEAAHLGDKEAYQAALTYYDSILDTVLNAMGKDTLIIVTTDHGRGDGEHWTEHAPQYPESKKTWCLVINGQLQADSNKGRSHQYSTLSIRPTVEHALGIF